MGDPRKPGNRSSINRVDSDFLARIIELADDDIPISTYVPPDNDESFPEGQKVLRSHMMRERHPGLGEKAKDAFVEQHGKLFCEACHNDLQSKYGDLAFRLFEAHHTIPVAEMELGHRTQLIDIAIVCASCHRALHAHRPWLTRSEMYGKWA